MHEQRLEHLIPEGKEASETLRRELKVLRSQRRGFVVMVKEGMENLSIKENNSGDRLKHVTWFIVTVIKHWSALDGISQSRHC